MHCIPGSLYSINLHGTAVVVSLEGSKVVGPHSVQNSSLFLHPLVGVADPARLAWHTHRDPREEGGERREERGRGE